jgi:hypothetical protein
MHPIFRRQNQMAKVSTQYQKKQKHKTASETRTLKDMVERLSEGRCFEHLREDRGTCRRNLSRDDPIWLK